uniref:hypothetical protein n=1 Tax=Nonomuraea bangladeshensis TaxID=404385 RepID=UPI003F49A2D9
MVTTYAIALVEAVTGLIAAAGVLTVLHPALMPLMVIVTVPSAWGAVRMARARFTSMKRWTELQRQLETLSELLIGASPAEELRAHRADGFLLHHYQRLARLSEAEQARLAGLEARTTLLSDGVAGLAKAGMYAVLAALLVSGSVQMAVAGTVLIAIRTGTYHLTALVSAVNDLYEQGLFVQDWKQACDQAEAIRGGTIELASPPEQIFVRDLWFSYPNNDQPSLAGSRNCWSASTCHSLVGRPHHGPAEQGQHLRPRRPRGAGLRRVAVHRQGQRHDRPCDA